MSTCVDAVRGLCGCVAGSCPHRVVQRSRGPLQTGCLLVAQEDG